MASTINILLLLIFTCATYALREECTNVLRSIDGESNRVVGAIIKKFLATPDDVKSEDVSDIYHYDKTIQDLVNYQIQQEMTAFYEYTNMAMFFNRHDKDYPGFSKYFHAAAEEELKHAHMFMKFQLKRGGALKLMSLPAPKKNTWINAVDVMGSALTLEKEVTTKILCLHDIGEILNDKDFADFLETNFIPEQYDGMRELQGHMKTLERMAGDNMNNIGLAEFQFDQKLQKENKN